MTIENLVEMLQKTGIPFAYDHFAEGDADCLPKRTLVPRSADSMRLN